MKYTKKLIAKYKELDSIEKSITDAIEMICGCYENGGKVLVCGNGGSAADSEHIVGELLKGFMKKRPLSEEQAKKIDTICQIAQTKGSNIQSKISDRLQQSIPAISLVSQCAIQSAVINDLGADLMFAQQVMGLGKEGDVLIGLSTSGNASNVYNAFAVAKANGVKTIAFTGVHGGNLAAICDLLINAPSTSTPNVQEYHMCIYHAICADCEEKIFEI